MPGIAVGVPALHHAVLDHQPHAALAGVVDQRRQHALGLAQVLGDAERVVAADEGADRDAAELCGGVDAGAQVGMDRLALGGVGVQVVVVVGERRELEPVVVEGAADAVGLGVVELVGGEVAGDERAVAEPRPGGELERFVAVRHPAQRGDLLERALRHAGAQQPELHRAPPRPRLGSRADSSTASVMRAARRPSASGGSPSAARLAARSPRRSRRRRRRSSPGSPAGGRRAG